MEPLVSIVIPAYNSERFISETIRSVLNQTYSAWELIAVNDGSTDATPEIIQSFVKTDGRIRLINQNNGGVSVARNNGAKNAKGDFLCFLDSDDVWLENNLKKKMNLLLSDKTLDFVFSDRNLIDEESNIIKPGPLGFDTEIFENTLLWNGEPVPGPCSNVVFKRLCMEKGISFHPELSNIADKHFIIQLSRYFKGKRLPEILFNYRIVGGSMSKNILLHETDTLKAYDIYKKQGLFKNVAFEKKCFANMYLVIAGSWWVNHGNKWRALYFVFLSFLKAPFHTFKKLVAKIF
ncbi:MAG: glycosyltransferase [Bacteroidia bacterium]|nr:glycosyltransferase [Bacteroidia bacterium]